MVGEILHDRMEEEVDWLTTIEQTGLERRNLL